MSLSSDLQELNVKAAAAFHSWATALEHGTTQLVQRAEQIESSVASSKAGPILEVLGKFALEDPDVAWIVSFISRVGKPIEQAAAAVDQAAAAVPDAPAPAGPIEEQARAAVTS